MCELINLNPYVRFATDMTLKTPWKLHERIIYDYELLYIKEGFLKIEIDKKQHIGKAGDLFFIKPMQVHSMSTIDGEIFRQPHIHFDFNFLLDSKTVPISFKPFEKMSQKEKNYIRPTIRENSLSFLPNRINITDHSIFEQLMFNVIKEYDSKELFNELRTKAAFLILLSYILNTQNNNNQNLFSDKTNVILSDIQKFLLLNIDRNITLDELEKNFNINKYHLVRLFKKVYNITPIKYHLNCRIDDAKSKILNTNANFSQISSNLGFDSQSAFNRSFKAIVGISPSEFRSSKSFHD